MMELETFFTVPEQSRLLLCAVLLGVPLGLCFDILRTVRLLVPHGKIAVMLEDVVFLLLWGVALMCFAVVLARGEMRGFYVLGSALGFLVYRCTLGACVVPVLRRVLEFVGRVLRRIFMPLLHVLVRICVLMRKKFSHFAEVFKKRVVFLHLPLNKQRKMLYNKKSKCRQEEIRAWRRKKNQNSRAGSSGSSAGRQ